MNRVVCQSAWLPSPFGLGRLVPMDWSSGGIYRRNGFNLFPANRMRRDAAMLVLRVGNATFCRGGNQQFLQQHGIRSEQATSGREALEFLRLYDYDMVLMDLH